MSELGIEVRIDVAFVQNLTKSEEYRTDVQKLLDLSCRLALQGVLFAMQTEMCPETGSAGA